MKCPQTLEVGVYVLGALSPAERDAFERHLDGCDICRAEVSDLAVLPDLLGRLDAETAYAVARDGEASTALPGNWSDTDETWAPPAPERDQSAAERASARWAGPTAASAWAGPTASSSEGQTGEDKVVSLLDAANRRRSAQKRRRRFAVAATMLAAACLAVVVGLGAPVLFNNSPAQPKLTAMTEAVADVPVTAELGLQPVANGTRVIMRCRYEGTGGYGTPDKWSYKMVAIPKSGGAPEPLSDWKAGPGDEYEITSLSKLKTEDISRVEIQNANDGKVLLVYQPA